MTLLILICKPRYRISCHNIARRWRSATWMAMGLMTLWLVAIRIIATVLLLQQNNGKFIRKDSPGKRQFQWHKYKDEGMLLFDANGDGKPDLYIASGGYKSGSNSPEYQDRIYINNGNGNFTLATDALPVNHTSKLCVRAIDFNNDGKLDLFVSGRVDPGQISKAGKQFYF